MTTITVAPGTTLTVAGGGETIVLGAGDVLTLNGSSDNVQGGANDTVFDNGVGNTVALGDNAVLVINGTGDNDSIGANSTSFVNTSGNTLTEGSGSYGALQGGGDIGVATGTGTFNLMGQGNVATVANGSYVGVVAGNGDVVHVSNGTVNTLNSVGVTVIGSGNQLNGAANSAYTIDGDNNQVTEATGSFTGLNGNGNTGTGTGTGGFNLDGANNTAVVASGAYVGVITGSTGAIIHDDNGTVQTNAHVSLTVYGSGNQISVDHDVVGSVVGSGDTLNEDGTTDSFNVQTTGGAGDTINLLGSSGDYVGLLAGSGYAVQGSNGTVGTLDNTGFTLNGNNDLISVDEAADGSIVTGSVGSIIGTGDTLLENGTADSFNVTNTGTGTDTVNFAGIGDYAGLLGSSGYVVQGSNGTVGTLDNTGFTLTGDNDLVSVDEAANGSIVTGSNGSINGTGDTLLENGTADRFQVSNTGSGTDTVTFAGSGDYAGLNGGAAETVNGNAAGDTVNLFDGATATVNGTGGSIGVFGIDTVTASNQTITFGAGQPDIIALVGGSGNTVDNDSAGDTVNLAGGTSDVVNGLGGSIGVFGDDNVTAYNQSITFGAGQPDVLGLIGGSGNTVNNDDAGDTVNLASGTSDVVNGFGGSIGVFGNDNVTAYNQSITFGAGQPDLLGLIGGSGNTVNNDNAGETVNLASGASATVNGAGGSIGIFGTNSLDTSNETINLSGDLIDTLTLSGTGDAINGANATIKLDNLTQANVYGNGNTINAGDGASGSVTGDSDTLTEGASDSFTVNEPDAGSNTVIENGAGDFTNVQNQSAYSNTIVKFQSSNGYAGLLGGVGYIVQGCDGTVETWANTGFAVNGDSDSIGTGSGSYGTVAGTGDMLAEGAGDSFTVYNSGAGANTVAEDGNGDYTNVQNLATGSTTNVVFNGASDYVGLIGSVGYTVSGSNGTIATTVNTSFSAAGSNNTIYAVNGSTAAVIGGGNHITASADTAVIVAGTGSNTDGITTYSNQAGDVTADGQRAGVTLLDGANANVVGDNDTILVGDNATLGEFGNGNATTVGTNTTTAIDGDFDQFAAVSGGSVTFAGVNNAAAVNGTAVYSADGNHIALSGASSTAGNVVSPVTQAALNAEDIDEIYLEVLGRGADPAGLADAQAQLVAGGSFESIRSQLAGGQEAQGDLLSTLSSVGADPASEPEVDGFSALMATSYDTPITLLAADGVTILADTSATNLLTELPVLETIDNGRTLQLTLPNGNLTFQTTAELTDFVYAVAAQKSQADSLVTDTFNQDIAWLNQVDQPMLNVAEYWSDVAAYDTTIGKASQAILANTASDLALDIAAEPIGVRASIYRKVSVDGHEDVVTVYPGTNSPMGDATFHDIDPGILGILETVGVVVLNVAAVATAQPELYYAAAAADVAEAGQDFSNGQTVSGLLSLSAAAGAVGGGLGGTAANYGKIINEAAQVVGGVYGAVQSAQNGDSLGILAGALEAAAGAAAGAGTLDPSIGNLTNQISAGLSVANTVVSVSDAFSKGNLAGGLLASLGPVLSNLAMYRTQDNYNPIQAYIDASYEDAGVTPAFLGGSLSPPYTLVGYTNPGGGANTIEDDQYDAGVASTRLGNAKYIPVMKPAVDMPVTQQDSLGDPIMGDTGTGQASNPALFPAQFNLPFILERGAYDSGEYAVEFGAAVTAWNSAPSGPLGDAARFAIESALFLYTPMKFFSPGALWDAQRFNSASGTEYTPASSIYIGAYAAEAGLPLPMIEQINDDAFKLLSHLRALPDQQMSSQFPNTPAADVNNIETGYKLVSDHLVHL